MARKFILVPSDQFQHLQSAVQEEPLIEHTKKQIRSILTNPKLNVSSKRALFDQEQLRLLRQRKEKADKPIKVTISSPKTSSINAIQKKAPSSKAPSTKPPSIASSLKAPSSKVSVATSVGDEDELQFEVPPVVEQEERLDEEQEQEQREPVFATPGSSKSTPSSSRVPRGSAKRALNQANYVIKVKIEDLIKKFPYTYGVDPSSGGIMNPTTNRPVHNSNWQTSFNYLTGGRGHEAPGTSILDRILRNNEFTREDFAKIRNPQIGNGFIPSLWS
jgi:hypothetical protein